MPVMNKMRDSMPVVFAGLAGIFLLMIIFEWGGQGMIFQKGGDAETIGMVNDTKISKKDYDRIYEAVSQNMKQEKKKSDLTEAEQAQLDDNSWDEAVTDALVRASIAKMGITVTDQEVRDQLFETPPAFLKGQFTDSLGQFHSDIYVKTLRDPKNDSIVRNIESQLREQILRQKWQAAITSTVRVTDDELHERFANENAKANVQVIKIQPTPADEQAAAKSLTDDEIKAYYDNHPWSYHTDEQRKFKFVIFQQMPTARDTALVMESANTVKSRLAAAPLDQIDTVAKELTADYSELPYQPAHVVTPRDVGGALNPNTAKEGDVLITPGQGSINVMRIIHVIDTGAPLYHVRHISIAAPKGQAVNTDSLKVLADKVYQLAKSGNFAEVAREYSSDPRSAGSGGDLGWLIGPQIPPALTHFAMTTPVGTVSEPQASSTGYEIGQVVERSNRSFIAASVPLELKPSSQTVRMQAQQASIFQQQATKQGFDQAAKSAGYKVIDQAPAASKKGAPIFGSREFVDWIFGAGKGDISQPIKISAIRGTIVAQLLDVTPAGQKPFDQVKNEIRPVVAKRKAIAALAARAKQIRGTIAPGSDLTVVPQQANDMTLQPVTVSMGPAESVNGIPSGEYAVNNTAFSMKPGEISQPVKGENGWYIIRLLNMQPVNEQAFAAQKPTLLKNLLQEKQQRFFTAWIQNMKDNANIVDYRAHR